MKNPFKIYNNLKKVLCLIFALFIFTYGFAQEQESNTNQEEENSSGQEAKIKPEDTSADNKDSEDSSENSDNKNSKDETADSGDAESEKSSQEDSNGKGEKLSASLHNAVLGFKYAEDSKLDEYLKDQEVKRRRSGRRSTKVVHRFQGGVTQIANVGSRNLFYVAGNDGFVSRFSYPSLKVDSWQFSSMAIKNIAVHPQGRLLAIYETDGYSIHQISLWDWEHKKNIFSKRISASVVSLSWSARGTYLFVGNRSVDGISVLDKRGKVLKIYKHAPGIVLLAATANSEKNIVTYGESGRLVYTKIKNRKKLKEFSTESFLNNPNVIDNFKRLIGYKNNKVLVISAISGKVIKSYKAKDAIFAAKLQDKKPIWIQKANKRYSWCIRQGDAESESFYIPNNSKITAARHIKNHMIIGTEDGSVYMLSLNVDSTVKIESPLRYSFTDIEDITTDGEKLFVLKSGEIYSFDSHKVDYEIIAFGLKSNRFTYYKDGFILWSNTKKRSPIYYYSIKSKKLRRIVTPREVVLSLSTYKDSILYVESFHGASIIDMKTRRRLFKYNSPGIQNIVQIDDKNVIVAKSAINKSQSPVFIINIKTQETLPIAIQGKLAFSLQENKSSDNKLNCFLINTKPVVRTELLRIHLDRKNLKKSKFKAVLSYKDEDIDAFLIADKYDILTNLGKSSIVYYNVLSKQTRRLPRSYSLPKKAVILNKYFVSMNYGGTISWYDRKNKSLLRTHGIEKNEE